MDKGYTGCNRMFRVLLVIALFSLCSTFLGALDAALSSVEIDLVLRSDGKADIFYSLEWEASGGEMHGFYFMGTAAKPVFNAERCFADIPGDKRVGLDIKSLGGGKYDVVLADGLGFTGKAYYFLNYGADFSSEGLIGTTVSDDYGTLFYFDWAPVDWEYSLQHRTVRIILPHEVGGEEVSRSYVDDLGLLTEEYVNRENLIDYFGSKADDGTYYLTIVFHQEDVPAYEPMRLQFYLPPEVLELGDTDLGSRSMSGDSDTSWDGTEGPFLYFYIILAVALGLFIFLYWRKDRGFPAAVESIEGIRWAGDNWVPPKLIVGSYQIPGKINKDLHPVEAALLLEMPIPLVVAILVDGLESQQIIRKLKLSPSKLRFSPPKRRPTK